MPSWCGSLESWEGDISNFFPPHPPSFFSHIGHKLQFFPTKKEKKREEIVYPHWGGWILDVARSSSLVLEWVTKVNVENRGKTRTIRWYLGLINVNLWTVIIGLGFSGVIKKW